jgi:diacylglycerol kinase (ATP)
VRLTIIFNPGAGRGRARRALAEALEVLRRPGVALEVQESRNSEELVEFARRAREEKPDIVVAAGGDGTVHFILQGLVGSEIPLGFLPVGSGNDFARGVGVPREPRKAAEVILLGKVREIDLARVTAAGNAIPARGARFDDRNQSAVYACIAGAGFDSVVTRFANEHVRRIAGPVGYAWSILRCLYSFRPQPLELRSDRRDFSGEVVLAAVGNNVSYGGGIRMTPRAQMDDGLLDVCIVPAMGRLELLRWLPGVYRGRHLAHPRILYFQARDVELSSTARMELFGDGEFIRELPARISVIPRGLRVLAP